MYERMLDKGETPSFDDLVRYSGGSGGMWRELDKYLEDEFGARKLIRFPYGNKYGWGVKYSRKSRHICDVFAENGAFTAHFHISNDAVDMVYDDLDTYSKHIWDNKYPCGGGGWIHFRVLHSEQLRDLKKIIRAKMNPCPK